MNANTKTGRLRKNRVEKWTISTLPAGSFIKLEDAKCHTTMAHRYATAKSETMLVYFRESSFLINESGTIAVTINSVIQNRLSSRRLSGLLMPASDVIIYRVFNFSPFPLSFPSKQHLTLTVGIRSPIINTYDTLTPKHLMAIARSKKIAADGHVSCDTAKKEAFRPSVRAAHLER